MEAGKMGQGSDEIRGFPLEELPRLIKESIANRTPDELAEEEALLQAVLSGPRSTLSEYRERIGNALRQGEEERAHSEPFVTLDDLLNE